MIFLSEYNFSEGTAQVQYGVHNIENQFKNSLKKAKNGRIHRQYYPK